jgi:hypothetical protein
MMGILSSLLDHGMSPFGTELPIRDVRFHGEYWGRSGLAADIAESTRMTQLRHHAA